MIVLPPKDSNAGCEVRLLLAECRSPAFKVYSLADAKLSMQYMDKVIKKGAPQRGRASAGRHPCRTKKREGVCRWHR
jgi:hypothetical protein